ncbi:MAG TPA: AAA family ATPase [Thermomicrobiales bacterium]|nr:AAA family ATPase [Thermomicrobiales bacterium]
MPTPPTISTLRELKDSGYRPKSVRDEVRTNLVAAMREGRNLFPGIRGYDDTVLPELQNAILAGHDVIFLGERGQAKTRLARGLVQLLDEWLPIVAGSEINDDPFDPVSHYGKTTVAEQGDDTRIDWVHRDRRFAEKLATPDTTVADLIGEVDPIKVAEGRYLSNEEILSFGLIPRTNRGIFNLNELPDLAERIQVGLLNILEERDIQIRGFTVRLPLDLMFVASANPEDYTNRGRIITPLKDRFGSQIRTHYPQALDYEIDITEQERDSFAAPGIEVHYPSYMQEVVAEISHHARGSSDVSQRSGVSVRMTVANAEALLANAQRRAVMTGEKVAVPRISDLPALRPSTMGKLELETFGEGRDDQVFDRLVGDAVKSVFLRSVDPSRLEMLLLAFDNGLEVTVSDQANSFAYIPQVSAVEELKGVVDSLDGGKSPAEMASAVEFVLEGLHQMRKLSRKSSSDGDGVTYAR